MENGGWINKRVDSTRASSVHKTQKEAELAAREMLRNSGGGNLVTKGMDGKIRSMDTISPWERPIRANLKPDSFTKSQAKKALNSLHIVPRAQKGWEVKNVSSKSKPKSFSTKDKAVEYARNLLLSREGEIVVHGRSGRIQEKISVANYYR